MDEFTQHCSELLAPLGAVRTRRMFGGQGIYVDELFMALIADEQLYLKTDAETRPRFEAAGCAPFRYLKDGEWMSMSYFQPPEEAMESPALMLPWARLALDAALRARAGRAVKPKRAPATRPKTSSRKPS
jgi:DNA transformation protein and related proteins